MKMYFVPLIAIALLISSSITSKAQIGFHRVIGDSSVDYPVQIQELGDSSFLVINTRLVSIPNTPNYIGELNNYKLNRFGNVIDTILITDTSNLYLESAIEYNYALYAIGILDSKYPNFSRNKIFLLKSDHQGTKSWKKVIGDTLSGYAGVKILQHNNYLYGLGIGDTSYNPQFIKLDTNGNSIFHKSINAPFMYGKNSKGMLRLADSTFILCGDGNLSVAGKDKWMIRIKEDGDTLFTKVLTTNGSGYVGDICAAYNASF